VSVWDTSKAGNWVHQLVNDSDLDPDEVARDAKLFRGLALFSVTTLIVLSVAMRILLDP
jgi:hypothetical protein